MSNYFRIQPDSQIITIMNMQKQQVKLVFSDKDGQDYHIFLKKPVGQGGYATVYQARALSNTKRKLVVKIMGIKNLEKKKAFDKQFEIMCQLQAHQNIVSIIPYKISSLSKCYIFMEYCTEGSLCDMIKKKKKNNTIFQEKQLYDIFYQCMNGYKALLDQKILHQDIKPENILIKDGVYKLADFGLSIYYETYTFGKIRQGTLCYIPPEKLNRQKYIGDPKSDVYAFGIMFYEIIMGSHPYVNNEEIKCDKYAYRSQLNKAGLKPGKIPSFYSNQFQKNFFGLILRMIKKSDQTRIDFQQIWLQIHKNQIFKQARLRQKQISKNFLIASYDFVVKQLSTVLVLSAGLSKSIEAHQEEIFKGKNHELQQLGKEQENDFIKGAKLPSCLDRLACELSVERIKMNLKNELYLTTILYLKLLAKSLLNDLANRANIPQHITPQKLASFQIIHNLDDNIMVFWRKYHLQYKQFLIQLKSETEIISKKQRQYIINLYNEHNQYTLTKNLTQNLIQLRNYKTNFIKACDKPNLEVLSHIIAIINFFSKPKFQKISTEDFNNFEKISMSKSQDLINYIVKQCNLTEIDDNDLNKYDDDEQETIVLELDESSLR